MPGEYRVTLLVGGKEIATKSVKVVGDIAVQMTDADRKTWHDTAMAFHRLQETANEAAEAVSQLGTQFQAAREPAQDLGEHPAGCQDGHRGRWQAVDRPAPASRRVPRASGWRRQRGGRGWGWRRWWGGRRWRWLRWRRSAERPLGHRRCQGPAPRIAHAAERTADARADRRPRRPRRKWWPTPTRSSASCRRSTIRLAPAN